MNRRILIVGFPVFVVGALATLVARIAGVGVPGAALVLAGLVLFAGALVAAALAAVALARRRWVWAAALVVAWPVTVPLYLAREGRASPSQRPEV